MELYHYAVFIQDRMIPVDSELLPEDVVQQLMEHMPKGQSIEIWTKTDDSWSLLDFV